MKIPLTYNLRSVRQRPVSTALTALGIGLVVAVFIGMLALANGFAAALTRTGSDRNVLVLRKGADSEMSSGLDRDAVSALTASPHVARGADGRALASPELYVVIPLGRMGDTTQLANVVVRGVGEQAWQVRNGVAITEGTRPAAGKNEICVGKRLVGRFPDTGIGETMHFAGRPWTVTCHFAAGGHGVRVGDLGRERAAHAGHAARGLPVARPSAWPIRPRSTRPSGCSRPTSG